MAQSTSRTCTVIGREPRIKYEGKIKRSYLQGEEYVAFFGIPYAARPVGLKRYQAPEKITSEENPDDSSLPIYKANKKVKMCTQFQPPNFRGSSDCLYLNIFLPKDPKHIEKHLPVLVFIHGGGFSLGSNDVRSLTPDCIVRHELVFVTINYRLGLFGFLNTQSRECPGNAGLKDQVRALEWIRDNISCFKGNPGNVTISGQSAGGTCVNMHLISPLSKNLFHKAIVQSGGIFASWGYKGRQREQTKMLLNDQAFRELLFAADESKELQNRTLELLQADRKERHPRAFSPLFGPTVERFSENAFMKDDIEEMMKNVDLDDKPVMAGIMKEESIVEFINKNLEGIYMTWVQDDQNFRQLLIDVFRWSSQTAGMFVDEIRNKYFPSRFNMSPVERYRRLAKLFSDIHFRRFYDNFKFGPEKTVHKNLYVYRFDHVSDISTVRRRKMNYFQDATHGDDLKYLYLSKDLIPFVYGEPDNNDGIKKVTKHICSLWANFCYSGVPKSNFDSNTVVWRRHTEESPCFLIINEDLQLIEESLYQEDWGWLNAIVNPQSTITSPSVSPEPAEDST